MRWKNFLCFLVLMCWLPLAMAQEFDNMKVLHHVDTSSPRATVKSFIESMTIAQYNAMLAVEDDHLTHGVFRSKKSKEHAKEAMVFLDRAISCLDLSGETETNRGHVAIESVILLKEVLDKIPLVHSDLPSSESHHDTTNKDVQTSWRIGNSKLVISRITEGDKKGEYLFSEKTIKNLYRYYTKLQKIPYQKRDTITPNAYKMYSKSPGYFVPPKWNKWIPESLNLFYYDQTLWQWSALILVTFLYVFSIILGCRKIKLYYSQSTVSAAWKKLLVCVGWMVLFNSMVFFLDQIINITGTVLLLSRYVLLCSFYVVLALSTIFVGLAINATTRARKDDLHVGQVHAVIVNTFCFSMFLGVILYSLRQVGFSLLPLITSLSVIGLAVAFSIRSIISNTIGMLMIYFDKVYRVNDVVNVYSRGISIARGRVKSIGFRSTSIEQLDGEIANIPNAMVTDNPVFNLTQREYTRVVINMHMLPREIASRFADAVELIHETHLTVQRKIGFSPTTHEPFTQDDDIEKLLIEPRITFTGLKNVMGYEYAHVEVMCWYYSASVRRCKEFEAAMNHALVESFQKAGIALVECVEKD